MKTFKEYLNEAGPAPEDIENAGKALDRNIEKSPGFLVLKSGTLAYLYQEFKSKINTPGELSPWINSLKPKEKKSIMQWIDRLNQLQSSKAPGDKLLFAILADHYNIL